uniref:Uncharacterized protein n=1 Tax=Romanomermis culicivorax TaxID=13658 RepID=A0A915I6H3_ROMCU
MERELKENMAIMNAKIRKMEVEYGFQKGRDAMPAVQQKAMEPPSPMKLDEDIAINKLVIDENVVKMLDWEMVDCKEDCIQPNLSKV